VVDADGRRLADPRIVAAGLRALRSLHRSGDALAAWAAAVAAETASAPTSRATDADALRFDSPRELTPG
jgi:hypothetical protein